MRYFLPDRFLEQLKLLPGLAQNKFQKQLRFLLKNLRHPSLRAKKYNERRGIWQARVDDNFRFYFIIDGDTYVLLSITYHPK